MKLLHIITGLSTGGALVALVNKGIARNSPVQ